MVKKKVTKKKLVTAHRKGKVTRERKPEIMANIREQYESGQLITLPKYKWAAQFGLTRPTFDKYLKEITGEISLPDIQEMKVEFRVIYQKLKQRMMVLWERAAVEEDTGKELAIMKEYRSTLSDFTKLLEDYGFKDKIADKMEVKSVNVNIDLQAVSKEILENIHGKR